MRFRKLFPEVTEEMLAKAALHPTKHFAYLPTRLHNGDWIWLESYVRAPYGLYVADASNVYEHVNFLDGKVTPRERKYELRQYRVGGGWDDDGEYFPHRNYLECDNSYQRVFNAAQFGRTPIEILIEKSGESNV